MKTSDYYDSLLNKKDVLCICCDIEGIYKDVCSSHTISECQLRLIAEGNQLGKFNYSYTEKEKKTHASIKLKKEGVKKASVFHGICSEHDSKIFHPIDNIDFKVTDDTAKLVFMRALLSTCSDGYKKSEFRTKAQREGVNSQFSLQEDGMLTFGIENAALSAGRAFVKYYENESLKIKFAHMFFQTRLPFAFSQVWSPPREQCQYEDLNAYKLVTEGYPLGVMQLIPKENGSDLICIWEEEHDEVMSRSFAEQVLGPIRLSQRLFPIGTLNPDQFFFTPSWAEDNNMANQNMEQLYLLRERDWSMIPEHIRNSIFFKEPDVNNPILRYTNSPNLDREIICRQIALATLHLT